MYDIILSVPMHLNKELERGYNQCDLIAKNISKKISALLFSNKILTKNSNTPPQSSLNRSERAKNVKQVYSVNKHSNISSKRIILIDDIYTTGSTANECSRLLKNNGASEIIVVTLAKD
jgi:ComF family protein